MKAAKLHVARREAMAQDPLSPDEILKGFYRPVRPVAPLPRPAPLPGSGGLPRIANHRDAGSQPPHPIAEEDLAGAMVMEEIAPRAEAGRTLERKAKPTHYKIVCISLYTEDIARLDAMVAELKRRGHSKANKSQLIRAALEQVDLDKVPKSH